jgi:hypothetical protein
VCLRTLRATLDGRFAEAEGLAGEALALAQSEYAAYVFRYAQMLAIRWAQGRVDELWPEIQDHGERFPWIPRWRDALAAAELGDERMARRELDLHSFADLPRDGLWILHLCVLAEACIVAGDRARALTLYELLLPHADDNAVSYTQQPFGPVALRLGGLAALLGRSKDADRFFTSALARCELLGAPALRARVLREHAGALAARGEPADRARWEAMREEAAQIAEELGMAGARRHSDAVFARAGDLWTIAYAGRTFRLRHVKGLGYIAALLAHPGRELNALELAGPAADPGSSAPVLDEQAKREYGRRLQELELELDEARRWGDGERAAQLEEELDFLGRELAAAVGLRGADRAFGSPAERARISVTKAIRTAIRLIAEHAPELGAHLDASIRTGRFCSYAPPGAVPPPWSL